MRPWAASAAAARLSRPLGVFEVLDLDDELRGLIGEKTDGLKIDRTAIRHGMTTMLDDGLSKCQPV